MVVAVLFSAGDHVPFMPLVEVVGNGDNVPPVQIGATWVKVGTTVPEFTVMVMVAVVAHWPAVGVKVYVVVAVLFKAGDHVPVMPLFDVVGNGDNVAPEHMAATCVNTGTVGWFTVIVSVAVVAHVPALGVNVYVVVVVLFSAGDHVPVIPLFDVVGNGDNVPPAHIGETVLNVGTVFAFIITAISERGLMHEPEPWLT